MCEIADTGYGISVNGMEFASFEDWLEIEFSDSKYGPSTGQVDRMKGEDNAEDRHELCPGETV